MRISILYFEFRQCSLKRKCPFYEKHLPLHNVKWATGGWYQFVCQQCTLVFGVVGTSNLTNCSLCDLSNKILLIILLALFGNIKKYSNWAVADVILISQ